MFSSWRINGSNFQITSLYIRGAQMAFFSRISEIGVQEISKSENLEPEIAVFEKAENGNLNARKLSATEI